MNTKPLGKVILLIFAFCLLVNLTALAEETLAGQSRSFSPTDWQELAEGGSLWGQLSPSGDEIKLGQLPKTGGTVTVPAVIRQLTLVGDGKQIEGLCIALQDSCQVTLVDLDWRAPAGASGWINAGDCALTVEGIVRVEGSETFPAIGVPEGSTLTLTGRGELEAVGGNLGAGIGGGSTLPSGTMILSGPKITALSPNGGAGIGAGLDSSFESVVIRGGVVNAAGGDGGAGIGGGDLSKGGSIVITGGNITAQGGTGAAGIGGGRGNEGGQVSISAGNILAKGGSHGAGIGGGWMESGGVLSISGGTITANGGQYAAGIGGGESGSGGHLTLSGGTVHAVGFDGGAGVGGGSKGGGGQMMLRGGDLYATGGQYGAGIGGGSNAVGGRITILDGNILAVGANGAAGIGGGFQGAGAQLSVYGGEITATGGLFAAGIGGGCEGFTATILIDGGKVTAKGNDSGAGIGGGYGEGGGNITVSGGEVEAVGGSGAAGVGGGLKGIGSNVTISGGSLRATGSVGSYGIGPGGESSLNGLLYIHGGSVWTDFPSRLVPQHSAANRQTVYPLPVVCKVGETPQPGVRVSVGGTLAYTDGEGKALLYLPAGEYPLQAYGAGCEAEELSVVVEKGGNAMAEVAMTATGAPQIMSEAIFPCSDLSGGSYQISATGGRRQRFSLQQSLDGMQLDTVTGKLFVRAGMPLGEYLLTVTVSNGVEPDAQQQLKVVVEDGTPPEVGQPVFTPAGYTDQPVLVKFRVWDSSDLSLQVTCPQGKSCPVSDMGQGWYSFVASGRGDYIVVVTDSHDNVTERTIEVRTIDGEPPVIGDIIPSAGTLGETALLATVEDSTPTRVWVTDALGQSWQLQPGEENSYTGSVTGSGDFQLTAADAAGHVAQRSFAVEAATGPQVAMVAAQPEEGGVRLTAQLRLPNGNVSYTCRWQLLQEGDYADIPDATQLEHLYSTRETEGLRFRFVVTDGEGSLVQEEVAVGESRSIPPAAGETEAVAAAVDSIQLAGPLLQFVSDSRLVVAAPALSTQGKLSYTWYCGTGEDNLVEVSGGIFQGGETQTEDAAFLLPLSYLQPGTDYLVKVRVTDEGGNTAQASETFRTLPERAFRQQTQGKTYDVWFFILLGLAGVGVILVILFSILNRRGGRSRPRGQRSDGQHIRTR